ncbi:MAG: YfhO family protein [Candidatus Saganbacteria bacterium]|nr:YfhO family protein [Candidatus Saganbacteria bacterium]
MSFFRKFQIDRRDLGVLALFLLVTLGFFARFLTGDEILAFKDLSRYFYPLRYLMAAQVKAGHLPLWDPYIFCGFPLLATLQIGFFYPLTLIYYLMPFNLAFNYYIILHYFLAACFMYALLRHFRLGRRAGFFGGLVFAFSGYLLSVSNMNTSLSSVIWLPLAVLFFDKLINSSFVIRHSSFIWLVLVLALMFLGGEPTIFYVTLWFLACYALVFAGAKLKSLAALGGAALLALALIAVQLFPFAELSRFSDRLILTGFDIVSFRSFPPRELLTFIFPYFFGNAAQLGGYTEGLLGKTYQDWLISPYLGVLPLLMALWAGRRRLNVFLWSAAALALLLAFGYYTPVYKLAYRLVPGVSLIRFPVKYLFLTTFCLSWLAALGFERLLERYDGVEGYRPELRRLAPTILILSALTLTAYLFSDRIIGFFSRQYANIPAVFFETLAAIIKFNLRSFFNLTAYLAVFTLLLMAATFGRLRRSLLAYLLVFMAAADLLANGTSIMVGAPAAVFSLAPPNYKFLARDRTLYRFFYTPGLAEANRAIAGKSYGQAVFNAKDNFAANWHIPYQLFDFFGYESIEPFRLAVYYRTAFTPARLKAGLAALPRYNVKYFLASEPLAAPGLKLLRHKYQFGQNVYMYESANVRPRAYLLDGRGRVTLTDYRPGFISMRVAAPRPAGLFLSEAHYPGWRAEIDGRAVEIREAERLFQQVSLPAGEHEVKFIYEPLSLKLGAGVSLLTICGLLIVVWEVSRKRKADSR